MSTKKIKGKWYVMDRSNKNIRELNSVASFVWSLLARPRGLDEVVDLVCDEYKVGRVRAQKDIKDFVTEYMSDGYILRISKSKI